MNGLGNQINDGDYNLEEAVCVMTLEGRNLGIERRNGKREGPMGLMLYGARFSVLAPGDLSGGVEVIWDLGRRR